MNKATEMQYHPAQKIKRQILFTQKEKAHNFWAFVIICFHFWNFQDSKWKTLQQKASNKITYFQAPKKKKIKSLLIFLIYSL